MTPKARLTRAQGEGGIMEASEEFLRALRKRCDEVGAALIFDEIQCGIGRTGSLWAHGSMPVDCHPDIITMAKPLANGIPIGSIMMRDKIADVIKIGALRSWASRVRSAETDTGDHGTTFGCASSLMLRGKRSVDIVAQRRRATDSSRASYAH